MADVTFADRCVMFVIVVVAIGITFAGSLSLIQNGVTNNGLVTIFSGVIMLVFTIISGVVIACRSRRQSSQANTRTGPGYNEDPPPKYRLTWRKEFIEMSPEHLRADLEKTLAQKPARRSKRRSMPVVWTTDIEVGAHDVSTLQRHMISSEFFGDHHELHTPQDTDSRVLRTHSLNCAVTGFSVAEDNPDEGLPSYDEALSL